LIAMTPPPADDEAHVIEAIYDAALDPAILDDVLARIRARLAASISILFAYDSTGPVPWHFHGFEPKTFRAYNDYYHQVDIYRHGLVTNQLLRSGAVFAGEQIVDEATIRSSAFVNELLRPNDFGPVCGSPLHVTPDGGFVELTFYRPVVAEPFGPQDLDFLMRIAPSFRRAARLRLRLEREAAAPAWTLELLDALPWGVIVLDARQVPVVVNREAERILAQADGLRLDRSGLYAEHRDDGERLRSALASAVAQPGDASCPGADVPIRRPSGARPLLLTVVPIGRRALDGIGAGSPRVMVHIVDPAGRPVRTAPRLRALFGLTPAEAALAQALAAGKSLQEHAEEACLTCETARWRLKQVLAKTDTHRQAELVRLLLATAALG
jgi:DNA-binding CsgD family transcriptional regulator